MANHSGVYLPEASPTWDTYDNVFTFHSIHGDYLLPGQEERVEVWNTFLTGQLLSSVDVTDSQGLELVQPIAAPTTFAPLEARVYVVRLDSSTGAAVKADYTFVFPSNTPSASVSATKVNIVNFPPSWTAPFVEKVEWATKVLPHYDGSEQRIKVRKIPRKSFSYPIILTDKSRMDLNHALWGGQGQVWSVPMWSSLTQLTAPAGIGDKTIYVDTTGVNFVAGGFLTIWADRSMGEVAKILTFTSTTVTLDTGLTIAWTKGVPVYPSVLARAPKKVSMTLLNPDIYSGNLEFSTVGAEDETAVDSATTYRGLPVMAVPPYWVKPINVVMDRDIVVLENLAGEEEFDDTTGFTHVTNTYHWVIQGREKAKEFREWIFARKGKLMEFWAPSYQPDFTMFDPNLASYTSISVANVGFTKSGSLGVGRQDLCIYRKDGTKVYSRISSSVEVSAVEEILTVSWLGSFLKAEDVYMISFLTPSRLGGDTVELVWRNPQLLEVSSTVVGLSYDV